MQKLQLPKSVKIGPQTFQIEFRNPKTDGMLNDSSYGYTLDQGNLIVVSSEISPSKQRVTVMHEIMHAARMIFEGTSIPKPKAEYEVWEHHFVSIFENAMLVIIQDNPELIDWLSS
jgi:hypothetical protein